MKLSNLQYKVLSDLSLGWWLVSGKVVLGRPEVCYLKNIVTGQVQMISPSTLRSLKRRELIMQVGENDTTISYLISDAGKKAIEKHF